MKQTVETLLKHRKRYYSQNGEDGLLAFVLSKLPNRTGWCVELGAWDGKESSNTYYLISQYGYQGVMIEARTPG
jgi:predicted carbohydrate-binding protein with CBM5 and CBM33 domain